MTAPARMSGVFAPVVTPFDADLAPDRERFLRHCRWLVGEGAGLAVFGTNSEANSMSADEKVELLDHLVEAGIPGTSLMPGTGACAVTDAIRLSAHAAKSGCGGVLMLPPFFYKGVSDDGLYDYYARVIEGVGDERLRVYLYHIPPMTAVPISLALIERLVRDFPQTVVGIKDSSGDWENTRAMLDQGWPDFRIFPASETLLLKALRLGGAGCISATANVNPRAIRALFDAWQSPEADALSAALEPVRKAFQSRPMIPALKAAIARQSGDGAWRKVRPPLRELSSAQIADLDAELDTIGFRMDGLA